MNTKRWYNLWWMALLSCSPQSKPEEPEIELPHAIIEIIETFCQKQEACGCGDIYEGTSCMEVYEAFIKNNAEEPDGIVFDAECWAQKSLSARIDMFDCNTEAILPTYYKRFESEILLTDENDLQDPYPYTEECKDSYGSRLLGEPCDESEKRIDDCAQDLFCDFEAEPHVCKNTKDFVLGLGEVCDDDSKEPYKLGFCGVGVYCNKETNVCEAYKQEGEACDHGECGQNMGCIAGKCSFGNGLGEYCGYDMDTRITTRCEDQWICRGDICGERRKEGESCSYDPSLQYNECEEGFYCPEGGVCQKSPGENEECIIGEYCENGVYCNEQGLCGPPEPKICKNIHDY